MASQPGLDGMRTTFGDVTWDGVKEKGVEPPRRRLNRFDSEYEPGFGSKAYFKKRANNACTEKTLKRKFPIAAWLPVYSMDDFIGDLIAGITVGFTIIPQGIAFAELANLPAQYGLYAGYIGSLTYIIFGNTKQITIGPAAVICILMGGSNYDKPTSFNIAFSSLLCLISGIFSMFMGVFKLGVTVEFISSPVIAGFVTAAAIVIIVSQMKSLLGLVGVHGEQLVELVPQVWSKLGTTNYNDMYMSIVGIIVLASMEQMKRFNWHRFISDSAKAEKFTRITFIVSSARNALGLIGLSVWAYYWNKSAGGDKPVLSMTKSVASTGIPPPAFPVFHMSAMNETVHGVMQSFPERNFLEMLQAGGSALFIIPLIIIVEQIAVCKTFSKAHPVDVNQEMISLGVTQMIACFFHSMPVTGSICRSCVNAVSGVRTPMNGIWSAIIVVSSLVMFTPYLNYIPKPALGAIVVCAVVHMIDYEEAIHIFQTKKRDLFPLTVTFLCCCFIGLEWGFLIGVIVNILMLLVFAASPDVPILKFKISDDRRVVILKPDRSLHYPGVEVVRNLISKKALKHQDAMIVVDCVNLIDIDFTGAKGLGNVANALKERHQQIIFVNVSPSVEDALRGFTHNGVETYETAQLWIDTLANVSDRHAIIRSMSSLDDTASTYHRKQFYQGHENGDDTGGFLSPHHATSAPGDMRANGDSGSRHQHKQRNGGDSGSQQQQKQHKGGDSSSQQHQVQQRGGNRMPPAEEKGVYRIRV